MTALIFHVLTAAHMRLISNRPWKPRLTPRAMLLTTRLPFPWDTSLTGIPRYSLLRLLLYRSTHPQHQISRHQYHNEQTLITTPDHDIAFLPNVGPHLVQDTTASLPPDPNATLDPNQLLDSQLGGLAMDIAKSTLKTKHLPKSPYEDTTIDIVSTTVAYVMFDILS